MDKSLESIIREYDALGSQSPIMGELLRTGKERAENMQRLRGAYMGLKEAISTGDISALEDILLHKGLSSEERLAVLNHQEKASGDTILHWAGVFNREKMVDMLVELGARVDLRNSEGRTPAEWARAKLIIRYGKVEDAPAAARNTYNRLATLESIMAVRR